MLTYQFIIKTLSDYHPQLFEETAQSAAVMIIFLHDESENLEIVLTKRALTLVTYAGDYSFPGGIKDSTDHNLYETAVRETQEELSLSPEYYQKIGELDDFKDRYGRLVRPFVVTMKKSDFLKMHKESVVEIIDIYFFPLSGLHKIKDNPDLYTITRRRPSYSYSDDEVFVWGLTATILLHLNNILTHTNKPLGKLPST
jgi:8-oxo-dGTP pyrophosphatase MutT (NUDIX family)